MECISLPPFTKDRANSLKTFLSLPSTTFLRRRDRPIREGPAAHHRPTAKPQRAVPVHVTARNAQRRQLSGHAEGRGPRHRPGGGPQPGRRPDSIVLLDRNAHGGRLLVSFYLV